MSAVETSFADWALAQPGLKIDRIDVLPQSPNGSIMVWYHLKGAKVSKARLKLILAPPGTDVPGMDALVTAFLQTAGEVLFTSAVPFPGGWDIYAAAIVYEP